MRLNQLTKPELNIRFRNVVNGAFARSNQMKVRACGPHSSLHSYSTTAKTLRSRKPRSRNLLQLPIKRNRWRWRFDSSTINAHRR